MKKSFIGLIFALSLLMILSLGAISASAENTSSANAYNFGTLDVNTTYSESGSVAVSGRDYWYKFTVAQAGELTITFSHDIINSTSNYWYFVCYQADAATYLTGKTSSVPYWKSAGNESSTVVDGIFLEAGTYFIRVTSGAKHSKNTYTLSLSYKYDDRTETEYNSDYYTADEIATNTAYRGALTASTDEDWYKFTLAEDGYVDISFAHAMVNLSDNCWRLVLYSNDGVTSFLGDTDTSVTKSWYFAGNQPLGEVKGIGLKAGTYYLQLLDATKYSDEIYTLTVNFTPTQYSEKESNQNFLLANRIELNKEYIGAVSSTNDQDWFTFTTESDGYFSITFDHEVSTSTKNAWSIYVYHADGSSYICDETNYWAVKNNVASYETPCFGVGAGTYFIKIVDNVEHSETPYTFTVNFTEADNWEKESNHTYLSANDMGTNRLWYGSTGASSYNSDDADWFKINVTYSANYTLTFSHAQTRGANDNVWSVALYKADGATKLANANVKGGSDLELDLGSLNSGTYYIRVIRNNNPSSVPYCISITDDHKHSYSSSTKYSPTQHISECTLCGETAYFAHTWNSGRVTVEPTCTEKGEKLYRCTSCYEEKTVELDPEHKIVTVDGKEATCTEDGYTKHVYCRVCEVVFEQSEPIAALGHLESDWINKGEVSCTDGVDRYKECIRCHTVLDEDHVEGVGHVFDNGYGLAPTCEAYGYTCYGCGKCGYSYEDDIKEALGHLESDWINRIEPSCTVGVDRYKECLRCSAVLVEEQADPIGHVFDAHVVEPTCTEQGYIRDVCVECGYSYESETIPATGKHSYGEPTEVNGNIVTVCSGCGDTVSTPAPKDESKGCGGTVGFGAVALVALVSAAGLVSFRKKEY